MKTFTKIFALLFAFTIISSTSLNAQFTDPNGDPSKPLLEIWVYGVGGTASGSSGDYIAAYDGDVCVGMLQLTVNPDETNWVSSHLIAYTYDLSGNALYTPGNPLQIRYGSPSGDIATGTNIDFHDTWYAPVTTAFYPAFGAYGYCYVDLTFATKVDDAKITVTVKNADGTTALDFDTYATTVDVAGFALSELGAPSGIFDGDIFAGTAAANYYYTVTITADGFAAETYTQLFNDFDDETYAKTIYMNAYDDLTGIVQVQKADLSGWETVAGVQVSTTIDGVEYSALTNASGSYTVEDVPDGTWDFTYSKWEHEIKIVEQTVLYTSTLTADLVQLDYPQGTISGEIFDAESLSNVTDNIKVTFYDLAGNPITDGTTPTFSNAGSGSYSITTYGGTYDILLEDLTGSYVDRWYRDYVLFPGANETLNFSMHDGVHTPYFTAITGNPNSMWTIQIEMAKFGGTYLLPFDEIAIYDTDQDKLVGSLVFEKTANGPNSGSNTLKAFAQFNTGATGFVEGNNMTFKAYDISHGEEYEVPINWWFNASLGTYSGTTFPDPNENHISYLNIYWGTTPGQLIGNITGSDALCANINGLVALEDVTVSLYNVFTGDFVDSDDTDASGDYSISNLDPGTYMARISKDAWVTYETNGTTEPHVLIVQSNIVTLSKVLGCQSEVTISYSLSEPGYHFISRCVEVASDEMLTLFNGDNGSSPDWDVTTMHDSWVANDTDPVVPGTTQLYWNTVPATDLWDPASYPWELLEGYQIFIEDIAASTAPYTFNMLGYLEKPETNPIALTTGISYIPYFTYDYSASPQDDALTAFDGILGELDWVMDSYGNRLHNDNGVWYDNIGEMTLGAGYKIKMNTAATLTYPASAKKSATNSRVLLDPVHFVYDEGNAAEWTYTMYINTNDFEIGDEFAAYSNDVLVGSMVIDSEEAWENNLNTFNQAVNGGYDINTPIELVAWDASEGAQYSVIFEMENVNGSCYLGEVYPPGLDHFSYVNIYRGVVAVDENQVDNAVRVYPNPTNSTLNIESINNINQITVYNIHGALISVTNVNAKTQQIDVSNFVTGTYLIQLHTDTGVITKRVIVK